MSNGLQAMVDAMGEMGRINRGHYHITLGKLIAILEDAPADMTVMFTGGTFDGSYPSTPNSDRGYYSDLAFAPSTAQITVAEFLPVCKECVGKTFEGYKGGDFTMSDNTPLWVAPWGVCGDAIVGHELRDDVLFLTAKNLDD